MYVIRTNHLKYPWIVDGDGLRMIYTSYEQAAYRALQWTNNPFQVMENATYEICYI